MRLGELGLKAMFSLAIGAALFGASSASAAVLVTEFLPDPSGTDIDREWFEIYNSGATPVDLSGYAAGDGTNPASTSTGEAMGVFPAGSIIAAGGVWVIAADAEGFAAFYGFNPNFEFQNSTSTNFPGDDPTVPNLTQKPGWGVANASLAIANGGDDVGILTPESDSTTFTFIDGGNHGTVTTFYTGAVALTANQSYERVPANQDTNTVSDWVVRTTGTATPGVVTVPEPASIGLALMGGLLAVRRPRRR
ncbi:MAG: lamin tail domain-containing protein [Tepidisphaeraceae bacterium]